MDVLSKYLTEDSGATAITIVPRSVVRAYYNSINGSLFEPNGQHGGTLWRISCNARLPDFSMYIESGLAVISGSAMVGKVIPPGAITEHLTLPSKFCPHPESMTCNI